MAVNVSEFAARLNVPVSTVRRIANRLAHLDGPDVIIAGDDSLTTYGADRVKREWFLLCRTSLIARSRNGVLVFRQCDEDPKVPHRTRMVDSDLVGVSRWVECDGSCDRSDLDE